MPDPEKNHMREIMQVQKPCILQTWPLETLCATAWFFFIPMRDLRETTVGPLMDALDYILLSFAPSAAAVWHCNRVRIKGQRKSVRHTFVFKHWAWPFIVTPGK